MGLGQQPVDQLQISSQAEKPFGQHLVAQIPWGHNILIFSKSKDVDEALFYVQKTIENGWGRNVLGFYIDGKLYERQGKAIHNFTNTHPETTSDLAQQLLKDPYQFEFLSLTETFKERELENALVEKIIKFLLELGSGFASVQRTAVCYNAFQEELGRVGALDV
jgi:predicted nuclease of restriction endonuclease-like (RecB) superfamily